jgi:hypothetical protein
VHKSTIQTLSVSVRQRLRNALGALALATALLALTAITAAARPAPVGPPPGDPSVTQTTVRVIAPANPFDWADAAIGAAGGVAISLVVVGAALAMTRRHRQYVRAPAA